MSDVVLNMLPLHEGDAAHFEAALPQATHIYTGRSRVTEEDLSRATVIMGWPLPEDLQRTPNLKWFHTMFAGYDEYAAAQVPAPGVLFSCSAGTNSQSVAEHMLACLLSLYRRLPLCRDAQKAHNWLVPEVSQMRSITGETVLILGTGNIGTHFAKLCRMMGAKKIIGVRRTPQGQQDGFDEVHPLSNLDSLLGMADIVATALPHSPQSENLFSHRRFSAMKAESVFINAGRGSVLDQDALISHLESGHLWGAAIDVTSPEPLPDDHPLWDAPNLIITPHSAGGMRLSITRENCIKLALENLQRYAAGQPLINQVQ